MHKNKVEAAISNQLGIVLAQRFNCRQASVPRVWNFNVGTRIELIATKVL